MCEISIIVPVYNVEKYLKKCVDSILAQTFTDFELILVDDGSPDNSGAICDQYAEQDSRVKVIHKENGGLSDARNAGIEVAKGKYLGFIDSDDYIAEDMYELLYNNIIREKADLSICGIYDVYKDKEPKILPEFREVCTKEKTIKMILDANLISVHAVNKLYKKTLFKNVRYPIGKITEDAAVILEILDQCEKIIIDATQKYFYFHRDDSISSKNFSIESLQTIEVWRENEKWILDNIPSLYTEVHTRVCWANFIVLDKIVNASVENEVPETEEIVNYLKSNFQFIMKNSIITRNRKISMILLMSSLKLYKIPSLIQTKWINKINN
ncbi:glycosyltransferase family 2 protein [Enterococcus xiangfangensis]|uniref:glycosyltransferase family 2 protein n=1 Tax=Enterococcus xiangfangensis TaxID=1296537 RepID=UPI0010F48626|nr:glycosyltransferase [Enterococcus xiangfangensis]MBM7710553.1 glycosyltransferase involved in cell wall biosynthesis [Enterococcus xiangfangensis]